MGIFTDLMHSLIGGGTPVDDSEKQSEQARIDGRTAALRALGKYLAQWTFYRSGGAGKPDIAFHIEEKNFHVDYADHEDDLEFPSIACIPGEVEFLPIGLIPSIDSQSENYDTGDATRLLYAYRETVTLEVWCASRAERRAFMRDLHHLFNPVEEYGGLRLRLPEYYDQVCRFTPLGQTLGNSPDEAINRRTLQFRVQLDVDMVRRVNLPQLDLGGSILLRVIDGSTLAKDGQIVFEDGEVITVKGSP